MADHPYRDLKRDSLSRTGLYMSTGILIGVLATWAAAWAWVRIGAGMPDRDVVGLAALGIVLLAVSAGLVVLRLDARRRQRLALLQAELDLLRGEQGAIARAHTQLLGRLCHEIRTPVHAVLGISELLLDGSLTSEQRRKVDILQASAEQLRALVDDALDLARLDAGQLELSRKDFEPRQLLAATVSIVRFRAESKGLEVTHEVSADVPQTLQGDPLRLRQLWLNLLTNAVKFTAEGRVEIRLDYRDDALLCDVEDSGVGISAADQERLFRPFERADTTVARSVEGTGLGLAICRHLVAEMDGHLGCRSDRDVRGPGSGSTFSLRLPLPRAAGTGVPGAAARDESSDDADLAGRRILVVDDDPVHRLVTASHLEELGVDVTEAAGGFEALTLCRQRHFDAVLVDGYLPDLEGPETVRRLRTMERDELPAAVILAVSADESAAARGRWTEAGADDLIAKPFHRGDLVGRLRAGLPAARRALAARPDRDQAVPASLSGSETLSALWQRGRRTGRDEVTRAIEGLRSAGDTALTDLRVAVANGRADDAATCVHGLAGVAAVLGCEELERLCRSFGTQQREDEERVAARIDRIERELDAAVSRLRELWPGREAVS